MLVAALVAFTLPAAAAVIYAALRPLWAGPGHAAGCEPARTYRGIALRAVLFVLAMQVLIVLNLSGAEWLRRAAPRLVVVLFGVFLAAVGNALPRTRPNLLFGIRTARTIDDRQLWIRLHRAAGYLAVAAGVAIAIAGSLLSKAVIAWIVSVSALGGASLLAAIYAAHVRGDTLASQRRAWPGRDLAVWALRVLLAVVFLYVGFEKFPGDPRRMWVRLFDTIGFGQGFRIFTGAVEIAGALLLLVPGGVLPGAALLCAAMIGALAVHVFVTGVGSVTVVVVILLFLLMGIALASRTSAQ